VTKARKIQSIQKQVNGYYKKCRKMYYSNHFEEFNGDVRKTWGLITSVIHNVVSKTDRIKELMIDNAICTASQKIADKFNDCFL